MSVKRNIIANYVGQSIAAGLSLALVPFYIRYLGMEAYGLVGLFAVIQAWMALLDLGMTPTLGREMARFSAGTLSAQFIRDLLRSLEILQFGIGIVIAVVLTLGADVLARHWLKVDRMSVETVAGALSMLGIVIGLRFCESIYRSGIMGLQQQVWLNAVSIALALLRSLGALAMLAFVSPTAQAFFVWQGLISVLTLVILATRMHLSLPATSRKSRFSGEALMQIRGFAGGIFSISLLSLMLTQVDKLLLSRMLGLTDFGYYMLASTIASALYLAGAPIILAVSPRLVRLFETNDLAGVSAAYHQASQLVTVVLGPAALLLLLFSRGVLFAWSGDAALAARTAPILSLLAVGTMLNALLQVPHYLQMASGWTRLAVTTNLVAVIIMVPLLLWSVPHYGALAGASIWAAVNTAYVVVTLPLMHRRLLPGEMWRWYGQDVLMPLGGAAMVLLPALLLRPADDAPRLAWLLFLVVTGLFAAVASASMSAAVRAQARVLVRLLRSR